MTGESLGLDSAVSQYRSKMETVGGKNFSPLGAMAGAGSVSALVMLVMLVTFMLFRNGMDETARKELDKLIMILIWISIGGGVAAIGAAIAGGFIMGAEGVQKRLPSKWSDR